jgi:putative flippase GtrA
VSTVGLRFGLVGILNSLVDLVAYAGLTLLGVATVPANLVSTTAGTVCSFLLNRGFTFRAADGPLRRQVPLFVLVNVVGLWVVHPLVIVAVEGALPWNFVLYSRLVFRHRVADATPSPVTTASASSDSGTRPGEE